MIRVHRIRTLTDAWVAELDRLDRVCLAGDDPYPKRADGCEWWIAEAGQGPLAFAGLRWIDDGGYVFLCRAGVLPGHRGQGLHRRLVRARVNRARVLGAKSVITYTVPSNADSSRTLVRQGFVPYTPQDPWVGNVCYWRRDL